MRLVGLVESPEHVCCRYRLKAYRSLWERAGHSLTLHPLPRHNWQWFGFGKELAEADVVILQRKLLAPWQLFLVRRAARALLFDFDDAIFLRDSYAAKGFQSSKRRRRFAAAVRAADMVVAGNSFLAAQAAGHTSPERVHIIPTCVDPDLCSVADHRNAGANVSLVWVGSSSTLRGLERARPLLEEIGRRCPSITLKLICDRFVRFENLAVVPCPWSEAGEKRELAAADIGISWIPDDPWSRGKCGLKVLQYMAAGLPVVANRVGVNAEMIHHGETGFLADTTAEWVGAIERLAGDPDMRRQFGRAGWKELEARYSIRAGADRWRTLLDQIGRRRKSA